MESPIKNYELKLTKILQQFLVPDYKIENDTYLEILLSQISGKYDAELGEQLIQAPLFIEWLDKGLVLWEQSGTLPNKAIQAFMINLTSIVSTNEIQFVKLELLNVFTRLCNVFKVENIDTNVSIKVAYIRLLITLLNHDSGIKWMFDSNRWIHVLQMCYNSHTVYVTREAQEFFLKLIVNNCTKHTEFCNLALKNITLPLQTIGGVKDSLKITPEIQDEEMQEKLTPMFNLISFIIDRVYQENDKTNRRNVAKFIQQCTDMELVVWNLVNCTHDNKFHVILTKILVQLYVTELNSKEDLIEENYRDFCIKLYTLLYLLIEKNSISAILNSARLCHLYWRQIITNKMFADVLSSCKIVFENQMIIFQIIPIINVINIIDPQWHRCSSEVLDSYVTKLFKISCQHTIRLVYSLRSALANDQQKNFRFAMESLKLFMDSRKYYDRERIVTAFQAMVYVFHETLLFGSKNQLLADILSSNNGILSRILEAIATLITEFKITWRESIETICILQLSVNLLSSPNVSVHLGVLAFKLIHLAIANFMAPNLALLMDTMEGSTAMLGLGPLCYQRLHDINWEIRDSALEVLHTVIALSEYKYPAFQKLIIENNLCGLIVNISVNDSESYVRSSALKCITAMVKVDNFWPDILEKEDLMEKTIDIIYNETEGVVRREAIRVMSQLYENERILKTIIPRVYTTMSTAAIADFHWEVKVNALRFWAQVICKELTNQGMIDGAFPEVTFSKESRKIVSLNGTEITNRLHKLLNFLAESDCLTVLILSLHDDCDISVVEEAVKIIEKIESCLSKYNMIDKKKRNSTSPNTQYTNGGGFVKPTTPINQNHQSTSVSLDQSNQTIDSIVNMDDINLLASVYRNQMKMDTEMANTTDEGMSVDPPTFKKITAQDFLNFLSFTSPRSIVDERNRWLAHCSNNLESLLDDMLKAYEECDINNIDCY